MISWKERGVLGLERLKQPCLDSHNELQLLLREQQTSRTSIALRSACQRAAYT